MTRVGSRRHSKKKKYISTVVSPQNIQSIKLSHFKDVTLENRILKSGKPFCDFVYTNNNAKQTHRIVLFIRYLTLRRRIKSHLLFAGIIRSSPFSLR